MTTPAPQGHWTDFAIAGASAFCVAFVGGALTQIGPWYRSLVKPSWQPPDWLFGPAWTVIFTLIAIAGVLAWRATDTLSGRRWLIGLFALNGVLNMLWSFLFFYLQRPALALIEVAFLWLSIVSLIVPAARARPLAGWLLAPYLAWVSFASFLNYTVVKLNGLD